MTSMPHSFGPNCTLQPASNPFTRRASEISNDAPKIGAHFFYSSDLPIDDPLSPIPPPSNSQATGPSRVPPRPFSVHDNLALEEAWQALQKASAEETGSKYARDQIANPDYHLVRRALSSLGGPEPTSAAVDNLTKVIRSAHQRRASVLEQKSSTGYGGQNEDGKSVNFAAVTGPTADMEEQQDADHIPFDNAMPVGSDEIGNEEFESGMSKKRHRSPFQRHDRPSRSSFHQKKQSKETILGASPSERNTTGTPFLRVSDRLKRARSRSSQRVSSVKQTDGAGSLDEDNEAGSARLRLLEDTLAVGKSENAPLSPAGQRDRASTVDQKPTTVLVPVGISRLHMVEMPDLKMGPIYWDPVHDVSSVIRGTWFYKDSMYPVEPDLANQLEEGYEYIKPWTLTYQDEVKSCLEVGPDAELKITHRLWPSEDGSSNESRPATSRSRLSLLATDTTKLEPDQRQRKQAIIIAAKPENRAAGVLASQAIDSQGKPVRLHAKSSVIYANARDAQILRPNQLPSVARGRKPLASIKKGRAVGIPVVRGFDQRAWEKYNPPSKRLQNAAKQLESAEAMRTAVGGDTRRSSCGACLSEEARPRVTDLVLVIHGIGQKLSERVESFHFTHAINAFRRRINWRSTLQLDDGGPDPDPNRRDGDPSKNQFTLKDITADSIPAIRNLISDVMLDIPYYLSHHKDKMIEAVIKEANRVFRLWIRNNPGFETYGRTHLIAHSLGSVMALDILSNQPTRLPTQVDLKSTLSDTMFEFDTTNVFFCGSPAGLFMLLNKAPLLPRKDRDKAGADGDDMSARVAGETGTYGCLAVDNLYNIMHYNDPIAYRLNACLDVDYAASLQPASVPSASVSWIQSFGAVFRSKPVAAINPASKDFGNFSGRPAAIKMPSNVEMETHNFSKEEIAEKRMYLLNDNGQIDFTLRSGGGPLEIQYLNMLSAHSSYWVLQDFVRFIVVEIGRKEGRGETIGPMRAVKKRAKV
ncbi:MAG: hypothetical protein Q9195_001446 [Heterodermia aff. obscurata]